jgi:hypothetical protein
MFASFCLLLPFSNIEAHSSTIHLISLSVHSSEASVIFSLSCKWACKDAKRIIDEERANARLEIERDYFFM